VACTYTVTCCLLVSGSVTVGWYYDAILSIYHSLHGYYCIVCKKRILHSLLAWTSSHWLSMTTGTNQVPTASLSAAIFCHLSTPVIECCRPADTYTECMRH
jgi:hypothetical protein